MISATMLNTSASSRTGRLALGVVIGQTSPSRPMANEHRRAGARQRRVHLNKDQLTYDISPVVGSVGSRRERFANIVLELRRFDRFGHFAGLTASLRLKQSI